MQLAHLGGNAADRPAPEAPRRAGVGLDAVAEPDGGGRRRHPSDRGRGVEVVSHQSGVEALPPAPGVAHGHHVGDQNMVVHLGVTAAGAGMARRRPGKPARRRRCLGPSPPAAPLGHQGVEIGEGGVAFGVDDGVHVLGPADHAQLGHRLRR
ncbi:MAG TPA: hypothetical protein VG184_13955 [Acidimicrobiales bacterium]|nr:hypothetical protein [Acidimicrobiales bacterium]